VQDVICTEQVSAKNGTSAEVVTEKDAKVGGQRMGMTNFVYPQDLTYCVWHSNILINKNVPQNKRISLPLPRLYASIRSGQKGAPVGVRL
jgi:hypothetical protein